MVDQGSQFQGWKIVTVAFAAQALALGLTIIPYGLFIDSIVTEFDTSVMKANLGLTLLMIVMTLIGPAIGPMLDRYSIRMVMVIGAVIMSVTFMMMSLATSLLELGLLLAIGIAVAIAMLGPLACTTLVAKWFDSKRGRAVGLAAMGIPAGGFLFTPLVGNMIESLGWRTTLQWFAALVLLIIPFIWFIVRNNPADLGQYPDGAEGHHKLENSVLQQVSWTTRSIVSTRNFWVLTLCFGIVFGVGGGWNANFPKFAGDLGYGIEEASYFLALGALLGIPGTLLIGMLSDQLDNRFVAWGVILMQALAFVIFWREPNALFLMIAVGLFGVAGGGLLPVYASLIGRLFGSANFGQVMGIGGLVALPFGALAPPLAGYLRDTGGDYRLTLIIFALSFGIAAVILSALRLKHSTQ